MENEITDKRDLIEKIKDILKKKKENIILNLIHYRSIFINNVFFRLY